MWVLTGPFDEDNSDGQAPDKSKLLKTGHQYSIGRKDQPILIKSKAISKAHALFVVASCSEEQATDPSFVPTLTFQNLTERMRPVERPSLSRPRVLCQPKSTTELDHGDVVHLSASIFVRVHWEKLCCYDASGKSKALQIHVKDCASLGIHIVPTLHPDVTHHLTPNYALTTSLATSIISVAKLVKPEWLAAVLAAGKAEPGSLSSLEQHFVLPPIGEYRPAFSPSLPPLLRKFDAWEPNGERAGMFANMRFIFVGEKGVEAQSAYKDIVRRGGADYECFPVVRGAEPFKQVLLKGQARGAKLVLVTAMDGVIAAVGDDGWSKFVEEAKSFELEFVHPDKIIEAVVYSDASFVECTLDVKGGPQQSVLPDVIPNTIENEPSVVPASGTLPTVSPAPALEPAAEAGSSEVAPRRRLPRRAVSKVSSRAPSSPPTPASETAQAALVEESQPEQTRRALVRRAGRAKTAATQISAVEDDMLVLDSSVEPPYKKHKSLFEEADPDRIAVMTEEAEESTLDSSVATQARGTKRKTQDNDEDVEMEADGDEGVRPRRKRRMDGDEIPPAQTQAEQVPAKPISEVVTRVDMAQSQVHMKPKPVSKKAQQQATTTNEPDKDDAFLKAVASTKRGKKTEDSFDREFNNLRISRPDLLRENEDEEWRVLEEFGDDGDVRGNFMVVVEMPVYRLEVGGGSWKHLRRGEGRLEWRGRQDFKRFKRKIIGERRQPIELVVEEENDLGIGSQYWKGSLEGAPPSQTAPKSSMTQRSTQRSMKERPSLFSDSDEEKPNARPAKGKSRGSKEANSKAKSTLRNEGKAGTHKPSLFMDEENGQDEDFNWGSGDDKADEEIGVTQKSLNRGTQVRGKTKTGAKKAPAIVIDDDSDDGATFKVFGTRARARR